MTRTTAATITTSTATMTSASATTSTTSVLFICTGNLYRSPIAERLLLARLQRTDSVLVGSAGTEAVQAGQDGATGVDPATQAVIEKFGGDAGDFQPRQLSAELIAGADLVLGLAREHREAAVALYPVAMRRCFTLKEFLRLVDAHGSHDGGSGTLAERVGDAAARRGSLAPPPPGVDDIADPSGKRRDALRRCAEEIDAAVTQLAVVLMQCGTSRA